EMGAILGDLEKLRERFKKAGAERTRTGKDADVLRLAQVAFFTSLANAETSLVKKTITAAEFSQLQRELTKMHATANRIRLLRGGPQPHAQLRLSPYSGAPPNHPPETEGGLPAQNVAGLGRTLFTDYLLPVELAGVLLTVATIGAIVIAG